MAELLVAGSFAFDTIHTPTVNRELILGGSGSHAAFGASFFAPVVAVGVVGEDWRMADSEMFQAHNIDVSNLELRKGGKTMFWEAVYSEDMNQRETLVFEANVMIDFHPVLNDRAKRCPYLFLANNAPSLMMEVIDQCTDAKLIVADTMNFYIENMLDDLKKLLTKVDGLILNDSEAVELTGCDDLFDAGDAIRAMGPRFVIIKKGSHGSLFMGEDGEIVVFPAYPTRKVLEPTGAGDCFAGAFMGYLASQDAATLDDIKRAMLYATVSASLTIEDFSFDALRRSTRDTIDARYQQMKEMLAVK
ncbi:MAG: PfkB family carbohydrate kinase [Planctomycetia bacterium]|nr:PfkB family carbohydrate kinase [Planctomycetia bacterium]